MKLALSCLPAFVVLALGIVAGTSGPVPPAHGQGMIPYRICDWKQVTFARNLTIETADTWTSPVCDGGGLDGCYIEVVWGLYTKDPGTSYWHEQESGSSGRMGPYCGESGLRYRVRVEREFIPAGVDCCLSVTAYNRTHSSPEALGTSLMYWSDN